MPTTGIQFGASSSGILGNADQSSSMAKTTAPDNWSFTGIVTGAIAGGGPKPFPWLYKSAWDGTSFIIDNGIWNVVLDPNASPLATGEVILPETNPPLDGQTVTISTTKTITALRITAGGSYVFYTGSHYNDITLSAGNAVSFI